MTLGVGGVLYSSPIFCIAVRRWGSFRNWFYTSVFVYLHISMIYINKSLSLCLSLSLSLERIFYLFERLFYLFERFTNSSEQIFICSNDLLILTNEDFFNLVSLSTPPYIWECEIRQIAFSLNLVNKCTSITMKFVFTLTEKSEESIKFFDLIFMCFEVDGGWSSWSHFSPCMVSCGEGTMSRERLCSNPRPAHNGSSCFGDTKQTSSCHDRECPSKSGFFYYDHDHDNHPCIATVVR